MAGILQLRRGLKSTYISEGTNLAEAFFVTENTDGSAISPNTLIVGVSGSVGDDVMTLAKLSLANKDNTYADYNSGSFWVTGDYTGSNMILSDNAIISGSAFIEGDLHLEGHLFLGSGSDDDVVRVQSEFSGSIVPDNDITGSTTPNSTIAYYDLGSTTKRFKNLFLQKDVVSGSDGGFISASHIDLTGNVVADNLGRFGTLRVDDLDDNRILVTAPLGQVEHDDNLQWDGSGITIIGDYYQAKAGATFQFDGAGMDITGSISNFQLRVDNGIIFTNEFGTLDNQSQFTWDGGLLKVDGNISGSGTLEIDGQSTLASLNVEDLTNDRILIAGTDGEVEDDQYFRYTGNNFIIGSDEHFKVTTATGNTFISGAVQMFSTLNVDDQSTLASVNVEDLTDNRVVIVGAGGEIEDDGNFTFNGTELNIGTGNFTVQQGSGNTQIIGTLDVDSQSTLASLNVEDLTDNRIVIVGTSGEIEDDGNLTFNGTELNIGTGNFTVQQGSGNVHTVGNVDIDLDLNIDGGDLTTNQTTFNLLNSNATTVNAFGASTSVNIGTGGQGGGLTTIGHDLTVVGDLTIQGETTQLNTTTLNVEDKNILIASGALNASAANGAGITIDGANATLTYESTNNWFTFDRDTQVQGDLYVTNEISSSTVNGIGNVELYSASVDSRLDYLEGPFSTSVDSRLDEIEGPMSTSLDLRLIEIFATGSDHETRIDEIETTFSSSVDSRLIESFNSSSDHETRIDEIETTFSSSVDSRLVEIFATGSDHETRVDELEAFSSSLDDTFATEAEVNSATSSLSSSLAVDIASNLSEITNLNSFSSSIESHLPDGVVSGSDQLTSSLDSRYIQSGSITGSNVVGSDSVTSIETITSASYAAITPVSGTLYIIVD
jgi:hypothetical protein